MAGLFLFGSLFSFPARNAAGKVFGMRAGGARPDAGAGRSRVWGVILPVWRTSGKWRRRKGATKTCHPRQTRERRLDESPLSSFSRHAGRGVPNAEPHGAAGAADSIASRPSRGRGRSKTFRDSQSRPSPASIPRGAKSPRTRRGLAAGTSVYDASARSIFFAFKSTSCRLSARKETKV